MDCQVLDVELVIHTRAVWEVVVVFNMLFKSIFPKWIQTILSFSANLYCLQVEAGKFCSSVLHHWVLEWTEEAALINQRQARDFQKESYFSSPPRGQLMQPVLCPSEFYSWMVSDIFYLSNVSPLFQVINITYPKMLMLSTSAPDGFCVLATEAYKRGEKNACFSSYTLARHVHTWARFTHQRPHSLICEK